MPTPSLTLISTVDFERQVMLLFKEALNNIRKHARARRIGIRLTQNGPDFSLLIADDGAGFDLAAPGGGHASERAIS